MSLNQDRRLIDLPSIPSTQHDLISTPTSHVRLSFHDMVTSPYNLGSSLGFNQVSQVITGVLDHLWAKYNNNLHLPVSSHQEELRSLQSHHDRSCPIKRDQCRQARHMILFQIHHIKRSKRDEQNMQPRDFLRDLDLLGRTATL